MSKSPIPTLGRTARLWFVDPAVARDVATWFLDAPSLDPHPLVDNAYRELELQTDHQFAALTDPDGPHRVAVRWTREPRPYADADELIADVRTNGVLEVTVAAAERDRLHPLLGCEPGGAYDRFRAVHDIVGHAATGFGFDRNGEYSAWRVQLRLYRGLARRAAATELHAENSVLWTTKLFAEHKAALIDPALLTRPAMEPAA